MTQEIGTFGLQKFREFEFKEFGTWNSKDYGTREII